MPEAVRAKPRLLVTGGSGFLALNWACAVQHAWDVVLGTHMHRVHLSGVSSTPLVLEDASAFGRQLDAIKPDVVVHTAGLTDVDRCEASPDQARAANADLARNVATATKCRSIPLIHISTDHLFTGERPRVPESEPRHPMNEYGRSKQQAEDWVLEAAPAALIVRTNFFGWGHATRRSFSDWIIDTLRAGRELSAFDDVFFSPILGDRVALWSHELLAAGASGVYNVCGDDRLSKHDFAARVAARFGLPGSLIRRASILGAGLRAPRPRDMSLDNTKARSLLAKPRRRVDEDLDELRVQEERDGRRERLLTSVFA